MIWQVPLAQLTTGAWHTFEAVLVLWPSKLTGSGGDLPALPGGKHGPRIWSVGRSIGEFKGPLSVNMTSVL